MTDTYVFLIREPDWDPQNMSSQSPEAQAETQKMLAAHGAFQKAVADLGARMVGGSALDSASIGGVVTPGKGDRLVEDAVYTDSPYADSSELITGFYAVEADDEETARRLAAMVPTGGVIEWRRVFPTG